MEKCLIFLVIYLSLCNGGRLTGLLLGAHHEIHNKVHDVADAVLGGLNIVHRQHQPPPAQRPAQQGGETIVVIVKETGQGGQAQHRPYGPQQGHYPPPNNPDQGYNPNNGYNQGNQNSGFNQGHHNQGYNRRPNYPVHPGQRPNQNHNNVNEYSNGNHGPQQNPNQQGQYNNGQGHSPNAQNNYISNGNVNPAPTGNPTDVINNPSPKEQKPNTNNNYKPTETYNGDDHHYHQAENTYKNDKTSKKPEEDGPLFVPLNDYTYGGDKIVINAPKRETDNKKNEDSDDDFPIDIRLKDE